MKKVFLFAVSALLLFCSCERLFESRKEKFDRLVAAHWDAWKFEGKDTTMCFVDIAKVMPIEWDTMVYVWYDGDDGNCACVYVKNDFIVRDRSNAKLRLERDGRYYILRDLPQRYLDSIRCVPDYKTLE